VANSLTPICHSRSTPSEIEETGQCNTDDDSVLESARLARCLEPDFTMAANGCWPGGKNDQKAQSEISNMDSWCDDSDATQALLSTLVGCIEELQGHVSYIFTQIKSKQTRKETLMQETNASTKSKPPKTCYKVNGAKSLELRRQAWEIKKLKATVRTLSARQRAMAKDTRSVSAKCNRRHRISLQSKACNAKMMGSCSLRSFPYILALTQDALHKSSEQKVFHHANQSKASTFEADCESVGATRNTDDAATEPCGIQPCTVRKSPAIVSLRDIGTSIGPQKLRGNNLHANRFQTAMDVPGRCPVGTAAHIMASAKTRPHFAPDQDMEVELQLRVGGLVSPCISRSRNLDTIAEDAICDALDVPVERSQSREGTLVVPALIARGSETTIGRASECYAHQMDFFVSAI